MSRAAVLTCALATVVVAGAGAVYHATHHPASVEAAGPDPVLTILPARGSAPSSTDSFETTPKRTATQPAP